MQSTHQASTTELQATKDVAIVELFDAVKNNDIEHFQKLINESNIDLTRHVYDDTGYTLMHWAAKKCDSVFIEELHRLGAPLSLPSIGTSQNLYPIHWATAQGNLATLKALLTLNVNVNTIDAMKNLTPLSIAAQNGHTSLAFYLLKYGAKVSILDKNNDSAVHWAAYNGATEIISLFHYLSIDVSTPDGFGQTPLHLAAIRGHFQTIEYLVEEMKCNISVKDNNGCTAERLARSKGFGQIANYLLDYSYEQQKFTFSMQKLWLWWHQSRSKLPYYYTIGNALFSVVVNFHIIYPSIYQLLLYRYYIFWNAIAWPLFILTVFTPAGSVRANPVATMEYKRIIEELTTPHKAKLDHTRDSTLICDLLDQPLCHTCHVTKPQRSKHCRLCKSCVYIFDHHCPFVNNCIGRDNYIYFIGFIVWLSLGLLLMDCLLYEHGIRQGFQVWIVFLIVYYFLNVIALGNLSLLHFYLLSKNLTTNEWMHRKKYNYLRINDLKSKSKHFANPNSKNICYNIFDRIIPIIQHRHTSKKQ